MNTVTFEPKYIPISWKPRLIAYGEGLFSLFLVAKQGWYLILFQYNVWTHSLAYLHDPVNDLLGMMFHACMIGGFIGWAIIAFRSAITGYAPTGGIVTYRDFCAPFPVDTSGDVRVTEESFPTCVALVDSRSPGEDCVDAIYRESHISTEVSHTENFSTQKETHKIHEVDELRGEDVEQLDEQDVLQSTTTRALVVYPEHSEERDVPEEQTIREIDEIRKVLYFFVSFFKELIVSVVLSIGPKVKRCQVNLDNRLKSFVGYLATRVKGTRLEPEDFDGRVFNTVEDGSVSQAKYDLRKRVNEAIKELDPEHPEIDVLELRSRKKRATYYNALTEDWNPFLPSEFELLAYHSLVRDIQADPAYTLNIPLEKWRRQYQKVIAAYKEKGFLGEHLEKDEDKRWRWAEAPYLHIRDGQLIFIFFCAEFEKEAGQQTDDPQIRQECLQQEAWLWREAVYTAITCHPDLERGEYALRRYLELCDLLEWHEAAKGIINQYYRLLDRHAPGVKLKPETLSLIEKVTIPLQKVDKNEE